MAIAATQYDRQYGRLLTSKGVNRITKLRKQEDSTQGQEEKTKPEKRQGGLLIPTSLLIDTQVNDNMNIPKEPTIHPIKKYIKK